MAEDCKEEYNRLKEQKQNNEVQQEACQAEINSLGDKIERLEAAYRAMDEAKESIHDIRTIHANMPMFYEALWEGSRARYFYDLCESGELDSAYSSYISSIDAEEDALNWEINELKEKQNEKYGILSGLVSAWDDLCTRMQNFFN